MGSADSSRQAWEPATEVVGVPEPCIPLGAAEQDEGLAAPVVPALD